MVPKRHRGSGFISSLLNFERANAKLNDYSFQLESRMKFLEEKITKFEQKHEEEPLVALRKSLSVQKTVFPETEQQVRPSSKEVEDGGRDQGHQGHLQGYGEEEPILAT